MSEKTEKKSSGFERVPVYYTTIGEAESMVSSLEARVVTLEEAQQRTHMERAVNQEKQKYIEDRFNRLDKRLAKIEGHVSRIVWLVIAAIIGAAMSFIVRGGSLGL
ncbi:MAG: hypothetical protein AAFR53_05530 [Pseudomonadota bacterium]